MASSAAANQLKTEINGEELYEIMKMKKEKKKRESLNEMQ